MNIILYILRKVIINVNLWVNLNYALIEKENILLYGLTFAFYAVGNWQTPTIIVKLYLSLLYLINDLMMFFFGGLLNLSIRIV